MTTPTTTPLRDTELVRTFMLAFDQPVRTLPTNNLPDLERVLRVRLLVEEALEFAEAMGCQVSVSGDGVVGAKAFDVTIVPGRSIDLVEAVDALADTIVVAKGSGHSLGLPVDAALEVVHETNMTKVGPDGRVVRHPVTDKIEKPAGWVPPTEKIRALLMAQGWSGE
jgi:predicted HAD superfamily Cof-like phosphohydrolase